MAMSRTLELCQNCVWETHSLMITTYCLIGPCDRCGRVADLAIASLSTERQPMLPLENA